MKIFFGADHAGFNLKSALMEYVRDLGFEVEDKGAHELNKEDDYPDFIIPVAKEVAANGNARGIIIGGSGQGEAMAANRINGARAAVFYGVCNPKEAIDISGKESDDPFEIVRLSRTHNDANILSLAARFLTEEEAKEAVKLWLDTPFSDDERHIRRIKKIDNLG